MALTIKGNRTGHAASTELKEQREWIHEQQVAYRKEFNWKYADAMDRLRTLDPDGYSKWYDDQPEQTSQTMYPVILARIEELKKITEPIKSAIIIRAEMEEFLRDPMYGQGYETNMQTRRSLGL
jgi:hypothetical protein